jgi:hypothetical protein
VDVDPVRPLVVVDVLVDPVRPLVDVDVVDPVRPLVVVDVLADPVRPFVDVGVEADPVRPVVVDADCPLRRAPAVSRAAGRLAVDAVSRRAGRFVAVAAVSRRAGRLPDAEAVSRRAAWPEATRWPPLDVVSRRADAVSRREGARPCTHTTSPRGGRAAVSPLACTVNGPVPRARAYGPSRGLGGTVSPAAESASSSSSARATPADSASSSAASYSAIWMLSPADGRVAPQRTVSAGGRRGAVWAAAGSTAASVAETSRNSERLRMVRAGAWAGCAVRGGP